MCHPRPAMESSPLAPLDYVMLTVIKTNQALPPSHLKTSSLAGGGGLASSPRSSPFRRPESPVSPSQLRQSTPSASPTKSGHVNSNSRFATSASPTPTGTASTLTPRTQAVEQYPADMFGSPRSQQAPLASTASTASAMGHGNALSQLQPAQVRTLREGFQILDRDSDGIVNREDVADMLNQLGMCPRDRLSLPRDCR